MSEPQDSMDEPKASAQADDTFTLWDLRVETYAVPGREMGCTHPAGSYFEARGEELHFPDGQPFPLYPLAALLPLLPAKQRPTDDADWMTTDTDIACPDPHCGAVFRISRIARRTFRHGEVTVVPMPTVPMPTVPTPTVPTPEGPNT